MTDNPFEHLREQHRKSKEALQPLKERWEKQFQKPAKTKEEIKAERLQEVRGKLKEWAEKGEPLKGEDKELEKFAILMETLNPKDGDKIMNTLEKFNEAKQNKNQRKTNKDQNESFIIYLYQTKNLCYDKFQITDFLLLA